MVRGWVVGVGRGWCERGKESEGSGGERGREKQKERGCI